MRLIEKIFKYITITISGVIFLHLNVQAQEPLDTIDFDDIELNEIVVRGEGTKKMRYAAGNTELITAVELKRAACCNLGESFTTNPSVDVSYTDAATGARQIRLLGLSGAYVQLLTENVPNVRGLASPYGLSYIAGPWLQSIQVSKGASSVKNGYESITGQINVELKKPQTDSQLNVNAYGDSEGKIEFNADGNLHLGDKWSGGLLIHGENTFLDHDANDDGFIDMPKVKQLALMNRWAYLGNKYVFQIAFKGLLEKRESGQIGKHSKHIPNPYFIGVQTHRLELFTKNAYIYDKENEGNIALILSVNMHGQDSRYGNRVYDGTQYDIYGSLMYERKWGEKHSISAGISYRYDDYSQRYRLGFNLNEGLQKRFDKESVPGIYGQYTLNLEERFIGMLGLRADYSSLYGFFVTPRMHLRYNPNDNLSFHYSIGTGRKSPHPLAEFNNLLASSRTIVLPEKMKMESGFNTGGGLTWNFNLFDRNVSLSGEYYYTRFDHQLSADLNFDPHAVLLTTHSKSYSHAIQAELTMDLIADMSLTGAYRLTDVRVNYGFGEGYIFKPLTSRHKGLITLTYGPWMGKWQFDATLTINGGGDMPRTYIGSDGKAAWSSTYPAFCQLNFQVTRNFRRWSVYLGGENLTNYKQKNPIIGASDPWGKSFDATMIWGPLQGAMVYIGFRFNLTKY